MRDALAERLLAIVMNWTPADIARERPQLQALASLKYDEYQQFSPGMRFVESLALWLQQFTVDERQIAYDFIRSRLIFLSEAEMAHFASVIYPDFLRPFLLNRAALHDNVSPYRVGQLARSSTFEQLQSSTLFFGLSDGSRIDQFRRSNREISHEQIFPTYDLPQERIEELCEWITKKNRHEDGVSALVLLDDFAGSGTSYVREERGQLKGKLVRFLDVASKQAWKGLIRFPSTSVLVALYVATEQALEYLGTYAERLESQFGAKVDLITVQRLDERLRITKASKEAFVQLIEKYYDPSAEDENTEKGGTDLRYGFAACGLPLVLHHNTPNNSLFILWAEDSKKTVPLFQRFSRHRRES